VSESRKGHSMGKEIYGGKYSLGKVDITVGLLRSFAVESYCVL